MAEPPPPRLMNFVSEQQLDEARKARGERADDGTAQRDRPLFEILKENKDRQDAEFNERFKHRPPKALDEDETEFLDKLEMSRREYERQMANEEAEQLRSFQEAVAAHSSIVREIKEEVPSVPRVEERKPIGKKNLQPHPLGGLIITVKPQAKKPKIDMETAKKSPRAEETRNDDVEKKSPGVANGTIESLVSYSDESDDEGN